MIPAKLSAGILRSAADCIEEQGGYKGQLDILGARLIAGVPEELEKVAKSVQSHFTSLCKGPLSEQEVADRKAASLQKVIDPEAAKKAAADAATKKAMAKSRPPLTPQRMKDLIRRSTSKPGAIETAQLGRKLKPLEAQHQAARSEWLASLKPGDIVRYPEWHAPAEIVTIDRSSSLLEMRIMNLDDGKVRETWNSSVTPYDEVDLVNSGNAYRVKRISDRLEDAASTGDTGTIKSLEAALK